MKIFAIVALSLGAFLMASPEVRADQWYHYYYHHYSHPHGYGHYGFYDPATDVYVDTGSYYPMYFMHH